MIDAVLLNGTAGAGTSTTAEAVSERLSRAGVVHAVIDVDRIRLLRPPPVDDPFQLAVSLADLRDVARNHRAAGATRLLVAGVVEHAEDSSRIRDALQPSSTISCRLTVAPATAEQRLRVRHRDDGEAMTWHLDRSPMLAGVLRRCGFDDAEIDTTSCTPDEVATAVLAAAGWETDLTTGREQP